MVWFLAAFSVFARPFGDGLYTALNALPVLCALGATLACLRMSSRRGSTRSEEPPPAPVDTPPPPALGPRLLAAIIGLLVVLGLAVVIVPGLAALGLGALRFLAAMGEQSAPRGALPFEQLLVPATDGLVRLSGWLILPGIAIAVVCAWRFGRAAQKTNELAPEASG